MSIEISPDEVSIATRVADKIVGRHPGLIERDEVISTLGLWMLEHEEQMLRLRERGHGLFTTLYREGARYVNRERAAVYGYRAEDQYRYSPGLVRELLKDALKVDWHEPPAGIQRLSSNSDDPAFAGNRLAMLVDVRAALQQIPEPLAIRLVEAVAAEFDIGSLAADWSTEERVLSTDAAGHRLKRALQRLVDELSELRADREHTGDRRASSNAQARHAIAAGSNGPRPRGEFPLWVEGGVLS